MRIIDTANEVKEWIEKDKFAEFRIVKQYTPLLIASELREIAKFDKILENSFVVNESDRTVSFAVEKHYVETPIALEADITMKYKFWFDKDRISEFAFNIFFANKESVNINNIGGCMMFLTERNDNQEYEFAIVGDKEVAKRELYYPLLAKAKRELFKEIDLKLLKQENRIVLLVQWEPKDVYMPLVQIYKDI